MGSTPTCLAFWGGCPGLCWWPELVSFTQTLWLPHLCTNSFLSFLNGMATIKSIPRIYKLIAVTNCLYKSYSLNSLGIPHLVVEIWQQYHFMFLEGVYNPQNESQYSGLLTLFFFLVNYILTTTNYLQ